MSNLTLKARPRNYSEAMKFLNGRESKIIGNNTRLEYSNGDVYATYHGNAIVRYDEDGSVWASWAGWTTSTTATRLNKLTDARFNIKNRTAQINGEDVDSCKWFKVS